MDWLIDIILSFGLACVFIYIGFRLGLFYNRERTDVQIENLKQEIGAMQKSADEQTRRLETVTNELQKQKEQNERFTRRICDLSFLFQEETDWAEYAHSSYGCLELKVWDACWYVEFVEDKDKITKKIRELREYVEKLDKEFKEARTTHQTIRNRIEPKRSDEK